MDLRRLNLRDGLTTLLFPRLCLHCRRAVTQGQGEMLCTVCLPELTPTDYHSRRENPLTDRLAGRLPIATGAALYVYHSPSVLQEMIHALKYYDRPGIGRALGRELGRKLRASPFYDTVNVLVPVPIHAKRRRERGYNQAEVIAGGVAEVLSLPLRTDLLQRTDFRGSQTKRGQLERLENVAESFRAVPSRPLPPEPHLLLIDDVMTTGATLDFSGNALLEAYPRATLSIATLGITV